MIVLFRFFPSYYRPLGGKYFIDSHEAEPTAVALDDAAARRLWDISDELVS